MFCYKCGTRALDDALFCQNCGARLIVDATAARPEPEVPASSAVRRRSEINIDSEYKLSNVPAKTSLKKKSKKLPIIFGVVALAVLAVIFIALNWKGKIDYEAAVKAHTPFADSQGLPYTYGEVFDKYIFDAKWDVRESGDEAFISISGKAIGTGEKISITVKASPYDANPDLLLIATRSVTINGNKLDSQDEAVRYLLSMFTAYDDGADDFSDYSDYIEKQNAGEPETVISSKAVEGLCYKGVPVDQLFGKSQDDIISILGEPEPSILNDLVYGDVSLCFDTWSLPEPYLELIFGGPFEEFTYNGQPFTDDEQRIIEIMGREPDRSDLSYPGQEYGLYSISYYLDCLGSTVDLDFNFPADEYSTQPASVNVYWVNPDAADLGEPGYDYPSEDYMYYDLPVLPDGFEWVEGPSWDTDDYGFEMITGVIQNISGKTKSYVEISFDLYDNNGYKIGSAKRSTVDLGHRRNWKFEAYVYYDAARYEFAELLSR